MLEMEQAADGIGARFIDFEDENISFNKKWFLTLLGAIKHRFSGYGLELRAMNGLFPPTLDEEVIREMKEAGFSALNLSLCTISKGQLEKFKRPDVREDFERALLHASEHGLETVGYIIVGAPGQSAEDSVVDLLYLASQKVLAGVSVFYPAPGSADFEKCRTQNLLPAQFSLMRSTTLPISDTTTRKESATLMRLGRILNFIKSLSREEMEQVLNSAESELISRDLNGDVGAWNLGVGGEGAFGINVPGVTGGQNSASLPLTGERRREIGKLLLASFFYDGKIRGMSPEGKTIEHLVSDKLCRQFRDGCLRVFAHC
jgi:anaerobic magnesium-protoporphyrin IX monomethyl ester cyclase